MMLQSDPEKPGDGVRDGHDPFWRNVSELLLHPPLEDSTGACKDSDSSDPVSHDRKTASRLGQSGMHAAEGAASRHS
jgi:hypothetical protein